MTTSAKAQSAVCASDALPELGSHRFHVLYRGESRQALLVRFQGTAYGYLNRCVHMPRELDCEHYRVFDEAGSSIRCSMHGITYRPETGECLSEICAGKSLTPLRIREQGDVIYLVDKRARLVD